MIKEYKNIIFDFDGTLANTAPDIINCLKKSFAEVLKIDAININRNIIGPPVLDMIKKIKPDISDIEAEALTKAFRVCYDDSIFPDTRLYEGVLELVKTLKSKGIKIFIVTNKPLLPTSKIIKKLKIDLFDRVITTDILGKNKLTKSEMLSFLIKDCHLDVSKSIMIGDTKNDVEAAKNNNIDSVAVLYGYGVESELKAADPKYIFRNIEEVLNII